MIQVSKNKKNKKKKKWMIHRFKNLDLNITFIIYAHHDSRNIFFRYVDK
jgi:hypothetical protein